MKKQSDDWPDNTPVHMISYYDKKYGIKYTLLDFEKYKKEYKKANGDTSKILLEDVAMTDSKQKKGGNMNTKKAMKKLTKALKEDRDYYYGWQSNIAMAISDEYYRMKKEKKYLNYNDYHDIFNQGAKNFLDLLIK